MSAVPLGADLGIEAASDLKQQLAPHLAQSDELVLDAAAVQRVHTASLQVLFSFFLERAKAGHRTAFADSSASFRDAARLLGLEAELGLVATDNNNNSNFVENAA